MSWAVWIGLVGKGLVRQELVSWELVSRERRELLLCCGVLGRRGG